MLLNEKGLAKFAIYAVILIAVVLYGLYSPYKFVFATSYVPVNTCKYNSTTQNTCTPTSATAINCASGTYRPTFACTSTNPGCIGETGTAACGGACSDCNGAGSCVSKTCAAGGNYSCAIGNYCNNAGSCNAVLSNGVSCADCGLNAECFSGNCGGGGALICCLAGNRCCVSNSDCLAGDYCQNNICLTPTALNPATATFQIFAFQFNYEKLIGTISYLDVFWNIRQPGASNPIIGANCTFYGTSTVNCLPKPFVQGPGPGGCAVQNPPYDYTKLNNVSCFVFDTTNVLANGTYNTSFYPLAINASASLGSLTVGQQVPLRVNVRNIGLLTDNYTVNITTPSSYIYISNPLTSTGTLLGNPTNESAFTQTGVTAFAAFQNPTRLDIYVNSTVNPSVGKYFYIQLTTGLASLPDFTLFGIMQIIILAALILFWKK